MRKEKRFIYVGAEQWATWQALAGQSGMSASQWVVQIVQHSLAAGGAQRFLIDSTQVTSTTVKTEVQMIPNNSLPIPQITPQDTTDKTVKQGGYHAKKHLKDNMMKVVNFDPEWYKWPVGPRADVHDIAIKFHHGDEQALHIIDENGNEWWALLETKWLYPYA